MNLLKTFHCKQQRKHTSRHCEKSSCHAQVHLPEARRGKTKKSKAKEEENAQQAAIYAANMAAQSGSQVRIFSLTEDGRLTEHLTSVPLQGETPHKLFGGPVLSISTKKIISRGMSSSNAPKRDILYLQKLANYTLRKPYKTFHLSWCVG